MKIALMNCRKTCESCTTSGCFRALHERKGHFEQYQDQEIVVMACADCGGCENFAQTDKNPVYAKKMERLREIGVEKVHFGACVCKEGKCLYLDQLTDAVEKAGMAYELGTH